MLSDYAQSIFNFPNYLPSKGAAFGVAAVYYAMGVVLAVQSFRAKNFSPSRYAVLIALMLGGAFTARGVFIIQNFNNTSAYTAFSVLIAIAPNFINLVDYIVLIILLKGVSNPPSKRILMGIRVFAILMAVTFGAVSTAGTVLVTSDASAAKIETAVKLIKASVAGQLSVNFFHIETELRQSSNGATQQDQHLHLEAQVRLVFEQLLHSEISNSCYSSLDVSSTNGRVTSLPSHPGVLLQVQDIMDVGISKHAMWEAVREKEDFEQRGIRPSYVPTTEEDDQEQSGVFTATGTQNRASQAPTAGSVDEMPGERVPKIPRNMLKLVLTDGRTQLSAVELIPIPQLDIGLPVGTKVLVRSGQILEQTGLLCLEQGSVQVLGGSPAQYQQHTLKKRLEGHLETRGRAKSGV
ncbi:hypothetical protein EV179_006072 [Coemansia sp. RSA 487]|nr:hypothetical protein EV179_006072 [Coemansia sp. RSA 487]